MRIAAVWADAHDRRVVREQLVLREMVEDALLHLGLADGAGLAHALGDEAEGGIVGGTRVPGRLEVHLPLRVAPARLELLHQVARRHHLGAERAYQLNGAGIDA